MKIERGRPIIEPTDHPQTIYDALRASLGYWREHFPDRADNWAHKAQNSWESLEGDHGLMIDDPDLRRELSRDGDTLLYLAPADLALAMRAYKEAIQSGDLEKPPEEIERAEDVLLKLDELQPKEQ